MGRQNKVAPEESVEPIEPNTTQPEESVVEWPLETEVEQEEAQEPENKYPGVGTRAYRQ